MLPSSPCAPEVVCPEADGEEVFNGVTVVIVDWTADGELERLDAACDIAGC